MLTQREERVRAGEQLLPRSLFFPHPLTQTPPHYSDVRSSPSRYALKPILPEAPEWPPPISHVRPLTQNSFVIYLVGSVIRFSCWPIEIVHVRNVKAVDFRVKWIYAQISEADPDTRISVHLVYLGWGGEKEKKRQ